MSERPLILNQHNYRLIEKDAENLLFHVPSSSLYEIEEEQKLIIKNLENKVITSSSSLDEEMLGSLESLDIIGSLEESKAIEVKNFPATTLILNIVSGCNLSCTYCYKADLTSLKNSGNMTFETATAAIDQLYKGAPDQENYTVTFFGGEPLSSFALIQEVTLYAVKFFKEKNANVDFTITTNGTLLTKTIIYFLRDYRFGVTISIDGPKAIHDKTRKTEQGKGSYDLVKKKALLLLENYKERPIGARVTLTAGVTDVETILEHLYKDLKFSEVGFAPATASDNAIFNLSEKELLKVFEGFKKLGRDYVEEALKGEFNGFSNLHRLIGDIHAGRKKSLPCGAGVGLLSVDYSGKFDLCHRFTGSDFPSFGDVRVGLDKPKLSNFIEKRANNKAPECSSCHIRNLCAGGCYHESYVRYNDASKAVLHYCEIMRDWIDFGLYSYFKIRKNNPEFFDIYFKTNQGDSNGLI
jgi:uncharacterized protein